MYSLSCIISLVITLTACLNVANCDIQLDSTGWTVGRKESEDTFRCPSDEVMIGRRHEGDENGDTSYMCARVIHNGNAVGIADTDSWSGAQKESSSSFTCPNSEVMIGRQHHGDENGDTKYLCSVLQSSSIYVQSPEWSSGLKESNSQYVCPTGQVMTGRSHDGDENGSTKYRCSVLRE